MRATIRRVLVVLRLRRETPAEKLARLGVRYTDLTEKLEGHTITIVGTQDDLTSEDWWWEENDCEP